MPLVILLRFFFLLIYVHSLKSCLDSITLSFFFVCMFFCNWELFYAAFTVQWTCLQSWQERFTCKDQKISENFYVRGDGTVSSIHTYALDLNQNVQWQFFCYKQISASFLLFWGVSETSIWRKWICYWRDWVVLQTSRESISWTDYESVWFPLVYYQNAIVVTLSLL